MTLDHCREHVGKEVSYRPVHLLSDPTNWEVGTIKRVSKQYVYVTFPWGTAPCYPESLYPLEHKP